MPRHVLLLATAVIAGDAIRGDPPLLRSAVRSP